MSEPRFNDPTQRRVPCPTDLLAQLAANSEILARRHLEELRTDPRSDVAKRLYTEVRAEARAAFALLDSGYSGDSSLPPLEEVLEAARHAAALSTPATAPTIPQPAREPSE